MAKPFCKSIKITLQGVLNLAEKFSGEVGTALLYSGGNLDSAQQSFLCLFPSECVWIQEKKLYHRSSFGISMHDAEDPWEALKGYLSSSGEGSIPEWVGYLGYELGAFSDLDKQLAYNPSSIPDACFFRPEVVLTLNHQTEEASLTISKNGDKHLSPQQWETLASLPTTVPRFQMSPEDLPEHYIMKVKVAQELIRAGEIYQVNLSQRYLFKGRQPPFPLFKRVAEINPAPFMAYLRCPKFAIISSSPERFLSKRGRFLETRPIKGTAPRGETPEIDAENRAGLLSSPKERAELLMITDLMRNDLGKVSKTGSVSVEKIWHCEAYTNVFHMLSIIRSEAKSDLQALDIIRPCFPGGSVTGCPKLRAMEVIAELEQRPRGIYTGSIGYMASNGDFDFNIAIRTLLWTNTSLELSLGGAIVADSDPEREYLETLYKGASFFQAFGNLSS